MEAACCWFLLCAAALSASALSRAFAAAVLAYLKRVYKRGGG